MPALPAHRRLRVGLCAALLVVAALVAAGSLRTSSARAAASWSPQCTDPSYPTTRDATNPLLLNPAPPASDPLRGAHFTILGPSHGVAAGAIAQLLGIDTNEQIGTRLVSFPESESWATFANYVAGQLPSQPKSVQRKIKLLELIAREPSVLRVSSFSEGGTPVGIYSETRKLFCSIITADPGSVPVISTYFLQPELGGCSTTAQINADAATFKAQIDALAQGVADNPAVFVAEEDAVGASGCMATKGSLPAWEALMKYEDLTLEALPHTVVYMEGGYDDATTPQYAAKMLNAAGVRDIQGFWTNGTHFQWDTHELKYAKAISKLTGGAHFIINTADNGQGPLLNPHPVTQGVEELCNPPGRGLGIPDTTKTPFTHLDAFLWTYPPGYSDGPCNGGPANGDFWPARAEALAANANAQYGPGYPSKPY